MIVTRALKRKLRYGFGALYLSGNLYWFARSWLRGEAEFGGQTISFWERFAGPAHMLAALFFIFVLGSIWSQHIRVELRGGHHRKSGWTFLALIVVLAISGVTILYGGQISFIDGVEFAHPIVGASLLPVLVLHWKKPHAKRGRARVPKAPRA
ncbi:MAG: hypothetical protein AB7P04_04750 [Bacteriovoracia bacterium]